MVIGDVDGATCAATKHAGGRDSPRPAGGDQGTGVRTTLVMPGIIRTDMIAGFAGARGTRIVGPDKVAAGILDAVRTAAEVFVPRELGPDRPPHRGNTAGHR